jgi:hypothetical protein
MIWICRLLEGRLGTETAGIPNGWECDLSQFTDGAAFSSDTNLTMDAPIFEGT